MAPLGPYDVKWSALRHAVPSRALIDTLLMIGGVEANPGPSSADVSPRHQPAAPEPLPKHGDRGTWQGGTDGYGLRHPNEFARRSEGRDGGRSGGPEGRARANHRNGGDSARGDSHGDDRSHRGEGRHHGEGKRGGDPKRRGGGGDPHRSDQGRHGEEAPRHHGGGDGASQRKQGKNPLQSGAPGGGSGSPLQGGPRKGEGKGDPPPRKLPDGGQVHSHPGPRKGQPGPGTAGGGAESHNRGPRTRVNTRDNAKDVAGGGGSGFHAPDRDYGAPAARRSGGPHVHAFNEFPELPWPAQVGLSHGGGPCSGPSPPPYSTFLKLSGASPGFWGGDHGPPVQRAYEGMDGYEGTRFGPRLSNGVVEVGVTDGPSSVPPAPAGWAQECPSFLELLSSYAPRMAALESQSKAYIEAKHRVAEKLTHDTLARTQEYLKGLHDHTPDARPTPPLLCPVTACPLCFATAAEREEHLSQTHMRWITRQIQRRLEEDEKVQCMRERIWQLENVLTSHRQHLDAYLESRKAVLLSHPPSTLSDPVMRYAPFTGTIFPVQCFRDPGTETSDGPSDFCPEMFSPMFEEGDDDDVAQHGTGSELGGNSGPSLSRFSSPAEPPHGADLYHGEDTTVLPSSVHLMLQPTNPVNPNTATAGRGLSHSDGSGRGKESTSTNHDASPLPCAPQHIDGGSFVCEPSGSHDDGAAVDAVDAGSSMREPSTSSRPSSSLLSADQAAVDLWKAWGYIT